MLRRRFVMMAINAYRWIFARARILTGHVAGLVTAATRLFSSLRRIQTGKTAPLQSRPAEELFGDAETGAKVQAEATHGDGAELSASNRPSTSVLAALVAYIRAEAHFIKKIFAPHTANISASDGAVTKSTKTVRQSVDAEMTEAEGIETASLNNLLPCGVSAAGGSVTAETMEAIAEATAEITAAAVGADGEVANARRITAPAVGASMAFWIYPIVDENGVLLIRQAHTTTPSGNELEVL